MARLLLRLWPVWTVVGVAMGLQLLAVDRVALGARQEWWRPLTTQVLIYQLWWLLTPFVLAVGSRYPLDRGAPTPHWLWHVAASVVIPLAYLTLAHVLVFSWARIDRPSSRFEQWFLTVGSKIHLEILTYWVIVAVQQWLRILRERQAQGATLARAEARARDAQLAALKMQLEPHFLFNTLNAISELIHDDPDAADAMVVRLGDFLRMTLESAPQQVGALREELSFLERYLAIEAVRFGDRLDVQVRVDAQALDASVPMLFLQPLAENAVRHGVAQQPGAGVIAIEATRLSEDRVRVSVSNTGPDVRGPVRLGVGLTNTTRRLTELFGGDATYQWQPRPEGGMQVTLEFPYRALVSTAGV